MASSTPLTDAAIQAIALLVSTFVTQYTTLYNKEQVDEQELASANQQIATLTAQLQSEDTATSTAVNGLASQIQSALGQAATAVPASTATPVASAKASS